MTTHEERAELMRIAGELRDELRSFTKRVHICINKLIGEADALAIEAADERSSNEHVTRKMVVFTTPSSPEKFPEKAAVEPAPKLEPGKRACSNCRKPGHRAKNCPEPDRKALAEAEKKGLKTGRKRGKAGAK